MELEGTIARKGFGSGTWAIVTANGETYELYKPPADLKSSGLKVQVSGQIRDDIMTTAMIGPVFEVASFQRLD